MGQFGNGIALAVAMVAAFVTSSPVRAQSKEGRMAAPIVFFDIAGPATAGQEKFYADVFGWTAGPGGSVSVPVAGPTLAGTLRTDPADKVIYVGVPDVTATLKTIDAHGGKTSSPRFEVKGVVVLGLFTDPAGNHMGLIELGADGKPKVP